MNPYALPATKTFESIEVAKLVIIALCFLDVHIFYNVLTFQIVILLSSPLLANNEFFIY